jgi:hypothetical protein
VLQLKVLFLNLVVSFVHNFSFNIVDFINFLDSQPQ